MTRAAIVAVLIAVLVGCARAEVTDKPPRYVKSSEEEQVSQLGQGGTARVALPEYLEPDCLDPYLSSCAGAEYLNGILFEGLLTLGPGGEYRPGLSAGVPSYDTGTLTLEPTLVELEVRENAAFSDGEPVTAGDVKWTFDRAVSLAESGRISPAYRGFGHVEAVEVAGGEASDTVRVVFDGSYSEWRDVVSAPILPEHVYGDAPVQAALPLTDDPVGTGPFMLRESGPGSISFTANPGYWRRALELPRLDGLEIEYGSPRDAASSLSTDRADFGYFTTARSAPDSGDLLRSEASRSRTETLVFDSARLDESTRASLSAVVNRISIVEDLGFRPARSVFPVTDAESPGWPDGNGADAASLEGVALSFVYPEGGAVRDEAARRVAAALERSGASVQVESVSRAEFFAGTLPEGGFDVSLMDFGSLSGYESLLPLLPSESSLAVSGVYRTTEEKQSYLEASGKVLAGEYAVVPLYVWPDTYAWSSTLSGPSRNVAPQAFAWNIRDWAFYK